MSAAVERMDGLRAVGVEKRYARAELRRQLRRGAVTLADVMETRPPEAADYLLIDIIRWVYYAPRRANVEEIGRAALRDGVNLMMPLSRASVRSRAWVAVHGYQHSYHQWRPSLRP